MNRKAMPRKWLFPKALSVLSTMTPKVLATLLAIALSALALLLLVIAPSGKHHSLDDYPTMDTETSQRFIAGRAAVNALLQQFGSDGMTDRDIVFPDDYGGKYFDENGYLFILTTQENFKDISFLSDNPVINDSVVYRYVPHSFNDLTKLRMFLRANQDYLGDLSVIALSMVDPQNALEIEMLDLRNKEVLLDFLRSNYEGFDDSMVAIIQGEERAFASNYTIP